MPVFIEFLSLFAFALRVIRKCDVSKVITLNKQSGANGPYCENMVLYSLTLDWTGPTPA